MNVTKSVTKIKSQHCNQLIYNADFSIDVAPTGSLKYEFIHDLILYIIDYHKILKST